MTATATGPATGWPEPNPDSKRALIDSLIVERQLPVSEYRSDVSADLAALVKLVCDAVTTAKWKATRR